MTFFIEINLVGFQEASTLLPIIIFDENVWRESNLVGFQDASTSLLRNMFAGNI